MIIIYFAIIIIINFIITLLFNIINEMIENDFTFKDRKFNLLTELEKYKFYLNCKTFYDIIKVNEYDNSTIIWSYQDCNGKEFFTFSNSERFSTHNEVYFDNFNELKNEFIKSNFKCVERDYKLSLILDKK